MAALETERLVVRVVYAGAPLAGKTASVRALMPLLKGPGAERLVMSPGEERGRTQFFDWADYDGGSFQGRPIHCQIASAPGQVALSDRRELVLRGADAVILVVDSQLDGVERALQCYEEMAPWLEEAGQEAPIRLLLQCNKQDLPGALAPAQLSRALGLNFGKDVFATSARTSKGLRAAFVAAVRVAVERARVLLERGLILPVAEIASGEELLERMQIEAALRELDAPEVPAPAAPRTRSAAAEDAAPPRARGLRERAPETARGVGERARPNPSAVEPAAARPPTSHANPPRTAPNLARDGTPGKGARPAVMPANAFYARVSAPSGKPSSSPFNEPEAVSDDEWVEPTPDSRSRAPASLSLEPASSGPRKSAGPERRAATEPRARPAILPMSAYRALSARAAASDNAPLAALAPTASEAPPSVAPESSPASAAPRQLPARRKLSRSLRPAVMPASAWRARPGAARDAIAVPAPPAGRLVWRGGARPAVMPASAWHAAHADAANDLEPEAPSSLDDSIPSAAHAAPEHRPTSEAPNTVVSAPGLPERPESESLENSLGAPRLPGQIAPRSTWPRANWRELAPLLSERVTARRDALGRWIGEIAPGWYARTLESASDLRTARRCLARAVLRQRALERYLSLPRCLALTEEGNRFWVWQIVFRVPTLAGTLGKLLDGSDDPGAVADALLEAAIGYLDARESFAGAPEPLPISLQALSSQAGHFVYSGLLPRSDVSPPKPGDDEVAAFRDALTKRWPEEPSLDARAVLDELERKALGRLPEPMVEIIRGVLIRQ